MCIVGNPALVYTHIHLSCDAMLATYYSEHVMYSSLEITHNYVSSLPQSLTYSLTHSLTHLLTRPLAIILSSLFPLPSYLFFFKPLFDSPSLPPSPPSLPPSLQGLGLLINMIEHNTSNRQQLERLPVNYHIPMTPGESQGAQHSSPQDTPQMDDIKSDESSQESGCGLLKGRNSCIKSLISLFLKHYKNAEGATIEVRGQTTFITKCLLCCFSYRLTMCVVM